MREVSRQRPNFPVDWDNVAGEIESLGLALRLKLGSSIRLIVERLLKLQYLGGEHLPERGCRSCTGVIDVRALSARPRCDRI